MTCPQCKQECSEFHQIVCKACNHVVGVGPLSTAWTSTPPTQPGWYWWHWPILHGENPALVKVFRMGDSHKLFLLALIIEGLSIQFEYIHHMKGQWAGPLEPPT